ncbi:hypothetical protein KIN20_034928 [Parelaphostrongylus tenuis]|uniref:Transmembrane protein n=1 Tax=Parelaphostrongylus tenuis TaxID=148309 RepID=A0AAD5RDD4_PARTN|nr:hypothetical protein KIN20_034928 [Parelaphostrongylus tenuis]
MSSTVVAYFRHVGTRKALILKSLPFRNAMLERLSRTHPPVACVVVLEVVCIIMVITLQSSVYGVFFVILVFVAVTSSRI